MIHLAPMTQALALAQRATGVSEPNPRVGCVLVSASGEVLGAGHTQVAGGAHAEVMALRDAKQRGHMVEGTTAYVTLEPCSHHGRTPPCVEALIEAGLARVVVALRDPNPLVAGQGVARLRAAGVEVVMLPPDDVLALQSAELNIGFLSRMVRQRPWVRMKVAASLDGQTALGNGVSQWITGAAARADGHLWRARAGALLTGIGTVLDDDPRLDVRLGAHEREGQVQPARVVLDSRWRTPPQAKILAPTAPVLIYGLAPDEADAAARARRQALVEQGAQAIDVAGQGVGPAAQVHLGEVLADLGRRGVNELHVEAGARLNAAFIEGGWVDELLLYLAPKVLGPGRGLADLSPLTQLSEAWALSFRDVATVGEDLRVLARPVGAGDFIFHKT